MILAFFAIYVLWGTTFLAIRIAVEEDAAAVCRWMPVLCGWRGALRIYAGKGTAWAACETVAKPGIDRVADVCCGVWAAVLGGEVCAVGGDIGAGGDASADYACARDGGVSGSSRFSGDCSGATLLGFGGVGVLLLPSGGQHFGLLPCLAIFGGGVAWALGSVLNRSLDLPESKPLTSGAAMMLGGGGLLALSAMFGELHPLPHVSLRAGLAILYLIVFGSLLGFTAFVWLLGRMPATRVASHAYVNPIVAVALGYFVAGEIITVRMLIGAAIVIVSVFLILRKGKAVPSGPGAKALRFHPKQRQ